MTLLSRKLLDWYAVHRRDLPWRRTRDPYAIWVAEIMLQQTRVETVIPYYRRWMRRFPDVRTLARAGEQAILGCWEGLGYYSRARNLYRASQIVVDQFAGKIPDNLKDLLSLPGIGRSTAGAILSLAYNKDAPILDGNAKRVLSRLFTVSTSSEKRNTENTLWQISESLIPKGFSNPFNQALMDLGSIICTPRDPLCPECPLRSLCKGRRSGEPERFPLRIPKKKIPHVEAVCAVIWEKRRVLLNQRPPSGLLGGLWEFPNWKMEEKKRLRLRLRGYIEKKTGMNVEVKESIGTFRQTYSHFKLTLHVYHCHTINGKGKGRWVSVKNLSLLPMSRIHRRIANRIDGETRG